MAGAWLAIFRAGYTRTVLHAAVTKEYHEDIAGPDDGDFDYRWWEYTFDFGGVIYRARVDVDEPACAYVLQSTDVRLDDPDRLDVLAFIDARLAPDGVSKLAVLGGRRGVYEVIPRESYVGRHS